MVSQKTMIGIIVIVAIAGIGIAGGIIFAERMNSVAQPFSQIDKPVSVLEAHFLQFMRL